MKKSYKSNWSLGRMGIFGALIAVSLSSTVDGMFSPAHAATGDNPAGTTITETLIAIPGTPLYNYGIIDISTISNLSEVLVYGMSASADGSHNLTNSGSINVEATITNASADASASAYGMYLRGAPTDGSEHRVENTGIITASATATDDTFAYEVYGENSYTVGTWATTLRDWKANDAVFAVNDGGTITFDNSKFIVRPGTADEGFKLGTLYNVKAMAANFDGSSATPQGANLTGKIASVETEVDFLKATLTDGDDFNNAKIRIDSNINEDNTPGAATAMQGLGVIQGQTGFITNTLQNQYLMRSMGTTKQWQDEVALASNGNAFAITKPSASANSWQAFILPHISTFDNSKYNFDGDSMGFMGGVNYTANDKFLVGMHFDLTQADSDADVLNMSSDINAYALGLHGSYTMQDWYINGQLTASISEADNSYRGNGILAGQANMDSSSLYASLSSGYIWTVAEDEKSVHTLSPQIGLSYLMVDNDSYNIHWNIPGYEMTYDDTSFDALYGNINMQWRSLWALENGYKLGFNADLGLRQNLTDDEMNTRFKFAGEDFTTIATEDATTITTGAGIELQKGNYGFNLNYEGAYGDEQTVHTGKFLMKMMF